MKFGRALNFISLKYIMSGKNAFIFGKNVKLRLHLEKKIMYFRTGSNSILSDIPGNATRNIHSIECNSKDD